jgi:hypothetical protein
MEMQDHSVSAPESKFLMGFAFFISSMPAPELPTSALMDEQFVPRREHSAVIAQTKQRSLIWKHHGRLLHEISDLARRGMT